MSRRVAGCARRRLAFWLLAAAVLACASGCGGAQREPESKPQPRREVLPEDQTFTAKQIEIQGIAFVPEALGSPPMPRPAGRRRPGLESQRKKLAAQARPSAADVQQLAALLWEEAARADRSDASGARGLREEARTALRSARARSAGKTDQVTLEMLAIAEMRLGDDAAASAAFEELLSRFPEHKGRAALRTWLAFAQLRQHRVADAIDLTRDWRPDLLGDIGAYVLAWVGFVAGDQERARRAIATAAAAWRDQVSRPAVERDLVLILARSGTPAADAARLVGEAAAGDAQRRYAWMFRLSEAFKFAGDYEAASAVLDQIVSRQAAGEGDKTAANVPPDDLVGFRFRQADYAFRLNRPAQAAARAMQAHELLAACGARCPDSTVQAVTERILKLAQFSHTVYARSLDGAHYDAAVALYQRYLAISGRSDADAVRGHLGTLQETRASADRAAGRHDLDVLLNFFWARREAVAACYEKVLLTAPALDGALELTLEIDARGAVTGAKSEPGAGAEGMAAVAGCVVERARTWTFPSRTVPGKTTLTTPLQFRLQRLASADSAPPATRD